MPHAGAALRTWLGLFQITLAPAELVIAQEPWTAPVALLAKALKRAVDGTCMARVQYYPIPLMSVMLLCRRSLIPPHAIEPLS